MTSNRLLGVGTVNLMNSLQVKALIKVNLLIAYTQNVHSSILYLLLFDDILLARNEEKEVNYIKSILCREFKMQHESNEMFLGMKLIYDKNDGILKLD